MALSNLETIVICTQCCFGFVFVFLFLAGNLVDKSGSESVNLPVTPVLGRGQLNFIF